jgi:O-antigen/teichoic acid export membrane protein
VVIVSATALNLALALALVPRVGALGMARVTVLVEDCFLLGLGWGLRRHGLKPITPGLLWRRCFGQAAPSGASSER